MSKQPLTINEYSILNILNTETKFTFIYKDQYNHVYVFKEKPAFSVDGKIVNTDKGDLSVFYDQFMNLKTATVYPIKKLVKSYIDYFKDKFYGPQIEHYE